MGPAHHQPNHLPVAPVAKRHMDHQKACSAKKLGCREYRKRPEERKPRATSPRRRDDMTLRLLVWKDHCCSSAMASKARKEPARKAASASTGPRGAANPPVMEYETVQTTYIGAIRDASRIFWMIAMKTKLKIWKAMGCMVCLTTGQR